MLETLFPILVVLGFFIIFGLVIYGMVSSSKKERQEKVDTARSLGFLPFTPDAALTDQIVSLYRSGEKSGRYELHNVYYRYTSDGECYLFDLESRSGDDTSYPEKQAVAVFSKRLSLPGFSLVPRADVPGPFANLANQAVTWLMARFEQPVDCSTHPGFDQRYLLSSPDPSGAREFFTPALLDHLAQTRLYTVKGARDGFLFSTLDFQSKVPLRERTAARVRSALDMLDALIKWGGVT